ncbi:MAG: hypothetical protein K9L85_00975 [Candidatus Peribacteraceae bacterium]|nr:hypothetical protein [Candidatus Peribacteraceae bacterium]
MSSFENTHVDVWVCGASIKQKWNSRALPSFAGALAKELGVKQSNLKEVSCEGFLVANVRRANIPRAVKNYLERNCRLVLSRDIKLKVREK